MKTKINFDGNWLSEKVFDSYKFTIKDRIKRSLKTFFTFFGAAILSILIPVLHFFLVPLFLVLSVFLSYRKFMEIMSIDLRGLTCPGCKINLNSGEIALRKNDSTVRLCCEGCRKNLAIIFEENPPDLLTCPG